MGKIIFNSNEEFLNYLNRNKIEELGRGSEGVCFASTDGNAIKVFGDEDTLYEPFDFLIERDVSSIILDTDINIKNFLFPTDLFIVNNIVRAYKTRKVKKNVFSEEDFLATIDYQRLIKAYYEFLGKVIEISKKDILLFDLPYNLLFDGNKLYAVDTLDYVRRNNPIKRNITLFHTAIESAINQDLKLHDIEEVSLTKNISIEEFFTTVNIRVETSSDYQYTKKYPYS